MFEMPRGTRVLDFVERRVASEAVEFLQRAVGCVELRRVLDRMRTDGEEWWAQGGWHYAGGLAIRNLLRVNGFDERALRVADLDDVYVPLLEYAAEDGPLRKTISWRLRFAVRRFIHRRRVRRRSRKEARRP
jgi:hypothetical protein